jgi:hypothetical protein
MRASFFFLFIALVSTAATCEKVAGDGKCIDEKKIKPDAVCYELYQPVCGCDGQTYPNDCYARKAGVTNWTDGECCIDPKKIDPDAACIKIYKPVCGCDGQTYSNSCVAEKAGVTRWTEGPCE